jgi:hypothetical protein
VQQCRTGQYNVVQYNTITHITQNNIQTLKATLYKQNYKKDKEHILYTINTQKRVELKIDESVFKTTRYTKH